MKPSGGRGRRISESETSLVYGVSSRSYTARATQRKKERNKKEGRKERKKYNFSSVEYLANNLARGRSFLGLRGERAKL